MPSLVQLLQQAGFRGNALRTAWAIAQRESSGNPRAFNGNVNTGDKSYGLFQINMLGNLGPARMKQYGLKSESDLFNPLVNARVAYQMSKGGTDFGAWGLGPNAYKGAPGSAKTRFEQYYKQFPGGQGGPDIQAQPGQGPVTSAPQAAQAQGVDPQQILLSYLKTQNQKIASGQAVGNTAPAMLKELAAAKASSLNVQVDPASQVRGNVPPGVGSLLKEAQQYLGTKYVFGGASPSTGFDCSGFVQYLHAQQGIHIPRDTFAQYKTGQAVGWKNLMPGDSVFFNTENDPRGPSHVGLYIGNGHFIQAPHTGDVVKISSLSDPYYQQRFVGGRRYA